MKKILTSLIVAFLLIINVEATLNELSFEEKNGKLYYDTDKFDKDIFIAHHDIVPGRKYEDKLVVKNNSKNDYDLYLRVNNVKQDLLADELIDNLVMEIYVEGKLVYEGEARGTEYDNNGLQTKKLIYLGKYNSGETKNIIVKTKLLESYTNVENNSTASIEWEFYAGYNDGVQPIIPRPNGAISIKIVVAVLLALLIILITLLVYRKKNPKKKMRTKKERE